MRIHHFMLAALVISGSATLIPNKAEAWGCEARGNGTSRGWSSRFGTRSEAANRALRECIRRPRAGTCRITYCDPRR